MRPPTSGPAPTFSPTRVQAPETWPVRPGLCDMAFTEAMWSAHARATEVSCAVDREGREAGLGTHRVHPGDELALEPRVGGVGR